MSPLRSLCVFCGSSPGINPAMRVAADTLGHRLAEAGITLVFGAGDVGLMGATARGALDAGGRVVGIIPEHLMRVELPNHDMMELHVVDSMHTRKRMMFDRADAICVLPGGLGTLDETFEILTWRQLALHNKPIILLNLEGYWDPLLTMVDSIIAQGFARDGVKSLFTVVTDVEQVLPTIHGQIEAGIATREGGESQLF